jgi:hypothetical protein
MSEVNMGVQLILTFLHKSQDEIESLVNLLSPFEGNDAVTKRFNSFYPKRTFEKNGRVNISHNGGYHLLATLYGATGNVAKVKLCFDSLLVDIDYFKGRSFNHYANVIGYLYQYNHRNEVGDVAQWIDNRTGLSSEDIYIDLIDRSGFFIYLYATNINNTLSESNAGYFHPNLCFIEPSLLNVIFDDYEKSILTFSEPKSVNFKLALLYKAKAIFNHKYQTDRNLPFDKAQLESWLENSYAYCGRSGNTSLSEKQTSS